MATSKADKTAKSKSAIGDGDFSTVTVTREVLEETPARALQMLMAINRSLPIRAVAESLGCNRAVRREGWMKIHAITGVDVGDGEDSESEGLVDVDVATAITTLDNSDEKLLTKVRATLQHAFPAEAKKVLDGLSSTRGSGAVLVVATLLDRLDALNKSESGRAALERLAQRGLTSAERARLRGLVATASGADEGEGESESKAKGKSAKKSATAAVAESMSEEEYLRLLRSLRAWFEEWSELLRSEISRRDYLIQLGLAERKSAPKGEDPEGAKKG